MNAIYSWVYDVKRHRCVLPRRSNLSQCREPSRGLICRKLDPFLLLIVISEQYRVLVGFIAFSDRVTLFFVELVLPWGECGQSILFCKYVYKEWLLLRELTVQQHQYVTHLGKCSHCPLISARVGHCGNESNHFLQKYVSECSYDLRLRLRHYVFYLQPIVFPVWPFANTTFQSKLWKFCIKQGPLGDSEYDLITL